MALGTALTNRVPGARTKGVPVSGGVAFMVIGLAALVLAFSAFAVVLRRSAPRTSPPADSARLTEATGLGVSSGAAERDAGQLRDRAKPTPSSSGTARKPTRTSSGTERKRTQSS